MICITGDMHADFSRFKNKKLNRLKKGDYLIVCGDFGFIWDGSKKEKRILKKIGKLKYNVLFVDGCHENYGLLKQYEETDWNGGKAKIISGKLVYLQRGYIYTLGDRKILAFGGGHSDDIDIRRESNTWWKEEAVSAEEIKRCEKNLEQSGNIVDYIITHEPPASLNEFLSIRRETKTEMNAYFDILKSKCRFKRWFFGKYHINKVIPPQFHALFDDLIFID